MMISVARRKVFQSTWELAQGLKITEKVSFNIASEALGGQNFNKKRQKWSFWRVFENLKFAVKKCYQTGQF